jgi:5-methylcytosine-specific restriction endonuclease McrA
LHDVLLLNANYEPLNVCNVRRAMTLVLVGKADVIHEGEARLVTSSRNVPVPSVVKMRYHVRRPMPQLRLSRHSVLARDNYTCQYPHTWDNLVACCRKCNLKKGDKTPQQANMRLRTRPRRPHYVPYLSLPKYLRAVQRQDWQYYLPVFDAFSATVN